MYPNPKSQQRQWINQYQYQDTSESEARDEINANYQIGIGQHSRPGEMNKESEDSIQFSENMDTFQKPEHIQRNDDSLQQTQKYFSQFANMPPGQLGYRRQTTDYVQRQHLELVEANQQLRQSLLSQEELYKEDDLQNLQHQMLQDTRNISHYTSFSQQVINPQPVLQTNSQQFSNNLGSEGAFSASTKMDQNYDFLISPNYAQSEDDFSSQLNQQQHQQYAFYQSQPISFQNLNIQPGSEQPFNIQGSASSGNNNLYRHTNFYLGSQLKSLDEFSVDRQQDQQHLYVPEFNSRREPLQTARISQEFQIEECVDSITNDNQAIYDSQHQKARRQSDQKVYDYQPILRSKTSQREYQYINEDYGNRLKNTSGNQHINCIQRGSVDISETFESGETHNTQDYKYQSSYAYENRENQNCNANKVSPLNVSAIHPRAGNEGTSNDHSELMIAKQLEKAQNKYNRNLFTKSPSSTIQTQQAFQHNLEFAQDFTGYQKGALKHQESSHQRKPLQDLRPQNYEEGVRNQPLFENKHKYFYNPYEINTLSQELKTIASASGAEEQKPYVALRSSNFASLHKKEKEIQSQIKGFLNEAESIERDQDKLKRIQMNSNASHTLQPKESYALSTSHHLGVSYLDTSSFSQMNAENERLNRSEINRLNFKQLIQPQSFVSLPDMIKAQPSFSQAEPHLFRTGYFNGRSQSQKPQAQQKQSSNEGERQNPQVNQLGTSGDQQEHKNRQKLLQQEARTISSDYQGYGSLTAHDGIQNRTIISESGTQQRKNYTRPQSNYSSQNQKRGKGPIFTPEIISKSFERTRQQKISPQQPASLRQEKQRDRESKQVEVKRAQEQQAQDTEQYSYIDTTEISMIEQVLSQNRSFDLNRRVESIFVRGYEALGMDNQNLLMKDPLEKAIELIALLSQEVEKSKVEMSKLREDEIVSKKLTLGLNENLNQAMKNSERLGRKYKRAKNKITQLKAEMIKLQAHGNFPQSRFQSQMIPHGQLSSLCNQGGEGNLRSNLTSMNAQYEANAPANHSQLMRNASFKKTDGSSSYQNLYQQFQTNIPKQPKKSKSQERNKHSHKTTNAIESDIDHSDLLSHQVAQNYSSRQNETIAQLQFELDEKEVLLKSQDKKIRSLIADNETLIDEGLLKDKLIADAQSQVSALQQSLNEVQNMNSNLKGLIDASLKQLEDKERALSSKTKDIKKLKDKITKVEDESAKQRQEQERTIAQLQDELNAYRLDSIDRDHNRDQSSKLQTHSSIDDLQHAKNDFFNHFCELFQLQEQVLFTGELFSLVCHLHFIFQNFSKLDQEVLRLHNLRQSIVDVLLSIESCDKRLGSTTSYNMNTTLNIGQGANNSDQSLSQDYSLPSIQDKSSNQPSQAQNESWIPGSTQQQASHSYNNSSLPQGSSQGQSISIMNKAENNRQTYTLSDQSILIRLQEIKSLFFDNEEQKFVTAQLRQLLHLKPTSKDIDVLDDIQNLLQDNSRLSKKLEQATKESQSMRQLVDFYVKINNLDEVIWRETRETQESRSSQVPKRKSSKSRKNDKSKVVYTNQYDEGKVMQIREHMQWQCNEILNFCDVCQIARKDLFLDQNLSNYDVLICLKEFVVRQQDSLRSQNLHLYATGFRN